MDQNNTGQGNEDTRAAEAHTQNAHENLEALRDQNRRTEATAGDSANHPVGQQNSGGINSGGNTSSGSNAAGGISGSNAPTGGTTSTGARTAGNTGTASEDNTQAAANVSNAQDNRDALAEQARRTEETTPDSVRDPIRQPDNQR